MTRPVIAALIITCPCALGLAVPAVTTTASGWLFREGLLIKNATALERLAQVDTVVFDKTGPLTEVRNVTCDTLSEAERGVSKAPAISSQHSVSVQIDTALVGVTPTSL